MGSRWPQWSRNREDAESLLALYDKEESINIALQAVLFEDGSAVGPDSNNWIPRWKAYLAAEWEVFSIVSQNPPDFRGVLTKG